MEGFQGGPSRVLAAPSQQGGRAMIYRRLVDEFKYEITDEIGKDVLL
jgi:hypothetical protein